MNLIAKAAVGLTFASSFLLSACEVPEENTEVKQSVDGSSQKPKPEKRDSDLTAAQENALGSAHGYIDMSGFSRKGLIDQLKFEGYSVKDATWAADHCGANWSDEAAEAAEGYLDMSSFSRSGLIDQLEFEGFTTKQAEYGVTQAGL